MILKKISLICSALLLVAPILGEPGPGAPVGRTGLNPPQSNGPQPDPAASAKTRNAAATQANTQMATPAAQVGQAATNAYGNDTGTVNRLNGATGSLMGVGDQADQLLANDQITPEDWLLLKSAMASKFMNAVNSAKQNTPSAVAAGSKGSVASPPITTASAASPSNTAAAATSLSEDPAGASTSLPGIPSSVNASTDETTPNQVANLNGLLTSPVLALPVATPSSAAQSGTKGLSGAASDKSLSFNDKAHTNPNANVSTSAVGALLMGSLGPTGSQADQNAKTVKALLKAQSGAWKKTAMEILKKAKAGNGNEDDASPSFEQMKASGNLALESLKKSMMAPQAPDVKSQEQVAYDDKLADIQFASERGVSSLEARLGSALGISDVGAVESENAPWIAGLLFLFPFLLGIIGTLMLRSRRQKKTFQLLVPGPSEHFVVRRGEKPAEYWLDIMDVRGKLVRTAGTLRPGSVARAAVLPPDLAAKLGAKDSFQRFELSKDAAFVPTKKEEGYQVFPFDVPKDRKVS